MRSFIILSALALSACASAPYANVKNNLITCMPDCHLRVNRPGPPCVEIKNGDIVVCSPKQEKIADVNLNRG